MPAAKGYTDAHKAEDYLGLTFTAQQFAQATQLVPVAEAYIDRCTGRAWLEASPTTDELHIIRSGSQYLQLENYPVLTVTALNVRRVPTDTDTLIPSTDYTLVDPERGFLYIPAGYIGYQARVTYTHAGPPLPADLALAATMLTANWLQRHIDGGSGVGPGIKSYSVGQELSVTYADSSSSDPATVEYGVPAAAKALIDGYRGVPKVFA